jgi:hypothetical protein
MLLGGFKVPVLAFILPDQKSHMDWTLTILGSTGALVIFLSRFATQMIAETNLVETKNLLTITSLLLFAIIAYAKTQF